MEKTDKKVRKDHLRHKLCKDFFGFIFYVAVALFFVLLYLQTGDGKTSKSIMGYSVFSVLTSSMESEIPQGSLVLTKYVPPSSIAIGDDITFINQDERIITHRVINIYENYEESGQYGFVTKGIENAMADDDIVYGGNMIGKVIWHKAKIGNGILYIKNHFSLVIIMAVLFMILGMCIKKLFSKNVIESVDHKEM
ncbi:MAG TPA: signal peptidase I [Candidatus Merdenecus merdavium]|nr:signal peptidase I [Candidatus Merdenecus merdavium]